jgi:hypothetical protein
MSDRWAAVDHLVRELGGLRVEVTKVTTGSAVEAAVVAALEVAMRRAADAVDRTIDTEDDEVVVQAWEAIVMARNTLAGLMDTGRRTEQIVTRSHDLRREAARLMMDAMALRRSGTSPKAGR